MTTALFPGSFDPPTNGHLEVIDRAARIFDKLTVMVLPNAMKNTTFSLDDRTEMLKKAVGNIPNVEIQRGPEGKLLNEIIREAGVSTAIKGIRNVLDYAYECELAALNRQMNGMETLFILTTGENQYISSSRVREIASFGGDISKFVPAVLLEQIEKRYSGGRTNE